MAEAVLDALGRAGRDRGRGRMKEIFFPKRMWRPRPRAQAPVRRRHRRRRLARARDRVLPREAPRHHATSRSSRRATSARARRAATRRSSARTTARPRARRSTGESVRLYEGLSDELDFNLMFSQHGHLTLAHSDRAMITMQERAEVNKLLGIDSTRDRPADEIAELCPELDLSQRPACPIVGALYHPPGGIIRHDAVVWGFARGGRPARRRDPPGHRGDRLRAQRTTASPRVETTRGRRRVRSGRERDGRLVDARRQARRRCRLPITTHILQAFVTEPVKPFLDVDHRLVAAARLRLADRPRRVPDRRRDRAVHDLQVDTGTLSFLEYSAAHALELLPQLERTKVLRTWTGLCDLSPDYSPILGQDGDRRLPRLDGLGDVRVQGGADRRRHARRARRERQDARPDRAVRAGALPHRHPRLRARRSRRESLKGRRWHDDALQPRDRPGRDACARSATSPTSSGCSTTRSSRTAATRRRSTSPSSTGSPTGPTRS